MDKRLIFKVRMLLVSFGVVIFGIKTLKSPEFTRNSQNPDSAMSLLLGSDVRPLNWCPEKTLRLELLDNNGQIQRTVESSQEISSLCETMIGGVNQDQLAKAVFHDRIVSRNSDKVRKILEQSEDGSLFRVQGMPFSSPMLQKAVERSSHAGSH